VKLRLAPEPALCLALLRIVVPLLVLWAPGFRAAADVASWDRARWVVPEGLGWFVRFVPISSEAVTVVQVALAFTAFAASLGLWTRLSLSLVALFAFYLYSIAQLTGFVWHDMHLLWFTALLAVSPCHHVLALDAPKPLATEGEEYAPALFAFRILFSCIYFFPGFHKLATSGIDWALSDNLVNQLHWKWAQHGYVPSFRLDRYPFLLRAGGVFTLVFELGFPLLVWFKRTRWVAALAGFAFHTLSQAIFSIGFMSLWLCYVGFLDLRPLAHRLWRRAPKAPESVAPSSPWPLRIVGGCLVVGALVQGVRGQMSSYPFACYPTFQWTVGNEMPDLSILVVDDRGRARELRHARSATGYRTQREWGELWRLAGASGPVDPGRLEAYYASVRKRPENRALVATATRVQFHRAYRSVKPEDRGRPPLRGILLHEIVLSPSATTK
jgi:hypothetical protein